MNPDTYARVVRDSGQSLGWSRVAESVAAAIPHEAIDRIWLFSPVRREDREWGTAVISRQTDEGRSRIYTASYLMVVRGRERGRGRVTIDEVGESPPEIVHEVIAGVQERAGEPLPPAEIAAAEWFPDDVAPGQSDGEGTAVVEPALEGQGTSHLPNEVMQP